MNLIFPDGFRINLTSEVTYTRYSPVFNALKGDWSFPFSIQGTDEILSYFNYPHLPQASVLHQRTYDNVSLYEGSFLIGNGTLTLQDCTAKQLIAHLNGTVGNIPLKVFEKRLNTLDLGQEIIPTVKIDNSQYFWELKWSSIDLQTQLNNITYRYYNCFIYKNGTFEGETGLLDYTENGFTGRSFTEFKPKQIKNFNEALVKDLIMSANDEVIAIYSPNPLTELKIVFVGYTNLSVFDTFGFIQFSQISYHIIEQSYFNNKVETEVYALPEIQNFKFYADAKGQFNGYINKHFVRPFRTRILINSDAYLSRYTIVPQLKLVWVLNSLFQKLNFEVSGNFSVDAEIIKILIFNLFSTDAQSTDTTVNFNVHSAVIKYANHLPNITISEFLKALMEEFGIGIEFNALTKTVEMFFVKDVLQATDNILDLNDRVAVLPKHKLEEIRKFQVSYNLSGDALAKAETSPYVSIPTKTMVDADTEIYEKIELKFPPLTKNSQNIPAIEAGGISPLFNQSNNETPLRLFFFEDKIGKTETTGLSLDLTKPNGIYQKYLKPKIDFEANTLNLETTGLMTILEIASFSFKTKILAYNVHWFCDQLTPKLKTGQEVYEVLLKLKRT